MQYAIVFIEINQIEFGCGFSERNSPEISQPDSISSLCAGTFLEDLAHHDRLACSIDNEESWTEDSLASCVVGPEFLHVREALIDSTPSLAEDFVESIPIERGLQRSMCCCPQPASCSTGARDSQCQRKIWCCIDEQSLALPKVEVKAELDWVITRKGVGLSIKASALRVPRGSYSRRNLRVNDAKIVEASILELAGTWTCFAVIV
jgi:hypothetical protein